MVQTCPLAVIADPIATVIGNDKQGSRSGARRTDSSRHQCRTLVEVTTVEMTTVEVRAMEEILTSGEVAKWIRISESTLCRWRQRGIGPHVTWMTPTCPRYRRADVDAWLARASA